MPIQKRNELESQDGGLETADTPENNKMSEAIPLQETFRHRISLCALQIS